LGHKLDLHSEDGRGSMFSVSVPLRTKDTAQQSVKAPGGITSGVENINIFYVDDEENNIHALSTLMRNWGCSINSATDLESAEDYAKNNHAPDVLLVDYQLEAEKDGVKLAGILNNYWGGIPVCIVSAAPDYALTAGLNEHGYDFLRKPIKPSKLRALLERYSQKKDAALAL